MNQPKPATISSVPKRAEAAWRRAYRPTAIGVPTISARAAASSPTSSAPGLEAVRAAATAQAATPAAATARSVPMSRSRVIGH